MFSQEILKAGAVKGLRAELVPSLDLFNAKLSRKCYWRGPKPQEVRQRRRRPFPRSYTVTTKNKFSIKKDRYSDATPFCCPLIVGKVTLDGVHAPQL